MEHFDFKIDRKYTVWEKETHTVKAESYEEAKKILIDNEQIYEYDTFVESEMIFDTLSCMEAGENDGFSTVEIFGEDDKIIWENGKRN